MSIIAQNNWLPYLRPSIKNRPTINVTMPAELTAESSRAAKDPRLTASHMQIDRVAALPEDWDGNYSAKPNAQAVEKARQLIEEAFFHTSESGWQNPYISASEDGEVVFEWWNGIRKLTIYIGPSQSTYLKSWGPNIVEDMEDGALTQTWEPSLWAWLFR